MVLYKARKTCLHSREETETLGGEDNMSPSWDHRARFEPKNVASGAWPLTPFRGLGSHLLRVLVKTWLVAL